MVKTCECGCGQPTRISPVTERAKGWVKGEPRRFLAGHWVRGRTGPDAPRWGGDLGVAACQCGCGADIAEKAWHRARRPRFLPGHHAPAKRLARSVPQAVRDRSGICECGCGERTSIAQTTSHGNFLGYPTRFIRGHAQRRQKGDQHSQWKGGRGLTTDGHVRIYRPDDHSRRAEHRLVMERTLGRPLKWFGPGHPDSEVVHHLNHVKTDNRPKNLVVLSISEHHLIHTLPAAAEARASRDNGRS